MLESLGGPLKIYRIAFSSQLEIDAKSMRIHVNPGGLAILVINWLLFEGGSLGEGLPSMTLTSGL